MSACPGSQHVIRANPPFPSLGPPRRTTRCIRFSAGYRHAKRHAPAGALPFGPGRRTGGAGRIPAAPRSPGNLRPSIESFATPHISGSYRLRRHFPRHCDVSTRAEHPYLPRFLPRDTLSTGSSPSGKRNFYSESQDLRVSGGRTLAPPRTCGCYQLAFVTPGISPFEAISRNWIRLMPNRRM